MKSVWSKRIIVGVVILALVGTGIFFVIPGAKKDKTAATSQLAAEFKPLDPSSKKIVAEYNGGKIQEGELNSYINMFAYFQPELARELSDKARMAEFKQERLQDLAVNKYIARKVASAKDDQKKVEETLKQIEKQQQEGKKTKEKLEKIIKGKGFTLDQLKLILVQGQKSERFVNGKLKDKTYDAVKLRHILISIGEEQTEKDKKKKRSEQEAKKLAVEVQGKLRSGADFSKLAKQFSDDPGSKDKGGLIEGSADQFVPEFANAAKTLPINKISEPVKTSFGYHVMKVESRTKEKADKAPEQVRLLKKQEVYQEIVEKELKFKSLLPTTKPSK